MYKNAFEAAAVGMVTPSGDRQHPSNCSPLDGARSLTWTKHRVVAPVIAGSNPVELPLVKQFASTLATSRNSLGWLRNCKFAVYDIADNVHIFLGIMFFEIGKLGCVDDA